MRVLMTSALESEEISSCRSTEEHVGAVASEGDGGHEAGRARPDHQHVGLGATATGAPADAISPACRAVTVRTMLPERYASLVGCRWPVQQAPMGSVPSADLVVAVADAGGVGSLTTTGMSRPYLIKVLDEITDRTSGVVAANFLTADVDPELVRLAAARVRVVDFFWSEPDPALIDIAHRQGALVSWQVGSVSEARAAVDAGADVVIAQGSEAGGHVRGSVDVARPVDRGARRGQRAGAGGRRDRPSRALAAVLAAGASGARIGTAFIATDESGAHPALQAGHGRCRARGDSDHRYLRRRLPVVCDLGSTSGAELAASTPWHVSPMTPSGEISLRHQDDLVAQGVAVVPSHEPPPGSRRDGDVRQRRRRVGDEHPACGQGALVARRGSERLLHDR